MGLYTSGDWVRGVTYAGKRQVLREVLGLVRLGFFPNFVLEPSVFFNTLEGVSWVFMDKKLK